METVFGVYDPTSDTEDFLVIFRKRAHAYEFIALTGSHINLSVTSLSVYDDVGEHPDMTNEKIREIALAKLSPREKVVLGIKGE